VNILFNKETVGQWVAEGILVYLKTC